MSVRSILVTGCSAGVGYTMAHGLRDRGYQVLVTARKAADLERLRGEGFVAIYLDYTEPASITAAVEETLEHTQGALYGLVNNGGYGQPGAIEDITAEVMRHQFEANVIGWHDLTRRLLPTMRAQGRGRVVNIGSVLAFYSLSFRGPYAATKHAIEALTWALRLELRGSGVGVSLIEPGPLNTQMRKYGYAMLQQNIDQEASPHRAFYSQVKARLFTDAPVYPNTREPEAILKPLYRALEDRRPRARYFLGWLDRLAIFTIRLLPDRLLEAVLRRISQASTAKPTPPV
jgi:NAD(P)-dependent dehydrogenase (short-subunit alcohol dehydrogenase family)